MADRARGVKAAGTILTIATVAWSPIALAQTINTGGRSHAASAQGRAGGQGGGDMGAEPIRDYPKLTVDTLANLEFSGLAASSGPDRGPQPYLRFDTTLALDTSPNLTFYGLFQFKARQPRPADDPNQDLFINQGAGRRVGGKMKELYVRYQTWRVGKFVQNFGRAYVLLPGPFAADFVEEPDQGYEPSEMIGVEKLHVFDSERFGWQQLSVAAFMIDRTFLHHSFPYDEGRIRYKDRGVGNTHLPENVMVTYDVLNMPVGRGAQASFQASAIRWGKSYRDERGEFWTTLGGDVAIPLSGSVRSTLERRYSQLHLYVEAARRANFEGTIGRARNYVSESAELLRGPWVTDLTATQRWTTDRGMPTQKDSIYTGTLGYNFPSQSLVSVSVARERVGDRAGVYAGLRLTQTLTTCSRCQTRGQAY